MMATSDLFVIIIGGGSSGLLLAQGLKQHGIKAKVYEREDEDRYQNRPREWGMALHWATPYVTKCIPPELLPNMNVNICTDPFNAEENPFLPLFNGKTGEKLLDAPTGGAIRVSRKKFRNFLSQGVDVEYGKKLKTINLAENHTVTALFEDGTSVTGSCIVGCDGAHSVVRRCLVGEKAAELQDLDIHMFNVCTTFPPEVSLLQRNKGHPVFKNTYHPDGFMWWQSIQDVKDPNKPETWLWQNFLSWPGQPRVDDLPDQASRLAYWKEVGEKFADPWRSVARALTGDLQFRVEKAIVWTPIEWSESPLAGMVTLAGDSAHCLPPHRGQGLNTALEDAAKLVEQLQTVKEGKNSLGFAIKTFEDEMRQRANKEIPLSVKQAHMAYKFDQLMESPLFKIGVHKEGAK